jgi:hypothetical protein
MRRGYNFILSIFSLAPDFSRVMDKGAHRVYTRINSGANEKKNPDNHFNPMNPWSNSGANEKRIQQKGSVLFLI